MKYLKTWWLAALALLLVPYLIMLVAGALWIYERGWLLYWMAISGVMMLACWFLVRSLRARRVAPATAGVHPAPEWPPQGHKAWAQVEAIAERVQEEDFPLDNIEPAAKVLQEVLETVAAHYHPKSKQAVLEIPVPYVLKLVELVSKDLREAFSEYVPGSNIVTLHDMQRIRKLAASAQRYYRLYRIASFGFDPASALLREMRAAASGKMVNTSTSEIKRWAVGFCVRKAGFYAIQLYSGNMVLDEVEFSGYQTPQSKKDARQAEHRDERLKEEPLRVLILGQAKSGKSSLINALFDEPRAAADVIPATRGVEPHVLEREGIPSAVILDTEGYEDAGGSRTPFARFGEQILQCDLLLVVCSAQSAARRADRLLLEEMRAFYQQEPDRVMPPLVVVLTHIDQLRPLGQWDPPYDLARPANAKAVQIKDAMAAVSEDLQIAPDQIVPVCLKPGQLYNVEEQLEPTILNSVSDAQRVKYLRCLRQFRKDKGSVRELFNQAANTGQAVLKAGAAWLGLKGRREKDEG